MASTQPSHVWQQPPSVVVAGAYGANPPSQNSNSAEARLVMGNNDCSIYGCPAWFLGVLDKELRFPTKIAKLQEVTGFSPEPGAWDGWIRLFRKPKTSPPNFPTGLVPKVQQLFAKFGIPVVLEDVRDRPQEGFPDHPRRPIIDRKYQLEAASQALKEGRGVLDMPPRCHAIGDKVLDFEGKVVNVEDVYPGNFLLSPDGTPCKVLERHEGEANLYQVVPWIGEPFTVTGNHILVLDELVAIRDRCPNPNCSKNALELLEARRAFLTEDEGPQTQEAENEAPMATGGLRCRCLEQGNPENQRSAKRVYVEREMTVAECLGLSKTRRLRLYLKAVGVDFLKVPLLPKDPYQLGLLLGNNVFSEQFEKMTFLPEPFKLASRLDRLELLAGLLDSVGRLAQEKHFEIYTTIEQIGKDIAFVARSVGLQVRRLRGEKENWRVQIWGELEMLPSRQKSKQSKTRILQTSCVRTLFSLGSAERQRYVGFTVEGGRYLHHDFTVLHNSGKTRIGVHIVSKLGLPTIWIAPTDAIVRQTARVFQEFLGKGYAFHQQGSKNVKEAKAAKVVVCTAATAVRLPPEFYKTREVFVCDEMHHSAAQTYKEITKLCEHIYYRFGMTGTFFRSGDDTMAMHALLSQTIYRVTPQQLVNEGYLVPTKVVYIPVDAPRLQCPGDSSDIAPQLRYGIREHDYRNQLVAYAAIYLSRVGRKVLVLVSTKEQGRRIERMVADQMEAKVDGAEFNRVEFISTDKTRSVQQRLLRAYTDTDEVRVLIGTSLVGEGVDLPSADALVYARGEKAEVTLTQNAYRVITASPGKREAVIVDFADRHNKMLMRHTLERAAIFHAEPIFDVEVLPSIKFFGNWCRQWVDRSLSLVEGNGGDCA